MKENIRDILSACMSGTLSTEQAEERLWKTLYERGDEYLLDLHREKRIGFPEVIFAEGKSSSQVVAIAGAFMKNSERIIVSNLDDEKEKNLRSAFPDLIILKENRMMVIKKSNDIPDYLGTAGLITAGTSDIPYAKECALVLQELGVKILKSFDNGAAGMHRPEMGLKTVKQSDLLVVFAGMEGVLPQLIASLSELPIIAVPTPIGYGYGGLGFGALSTMLQTCVPGVLVVNIGNTIGASAGTVRFLHILRNRMSAI